jgi:hypothetical protein
MTSADCRKGGKSIEVPSGGSPKPGLLGPDSLHFLGTMFALNVSKVSAWLTTTISLF